MNKFLKIVSVVSPKNYGYGSLLIAGIIERCGAKVSVTKRFHFDEYLKSEIIGVSFQSISDVVNYKNVVRKVRSKTNALIIAGGPATVLPEIVFKHLPWIDLVVVGEGEKTIVEILRNASEKSFDEIKGIAFMKNGRLVRTHRNRPISLAGRPLVHIPKDLPNQSVRGSNIYLETHRGCIGKCTFCLVPHLFGRRIRSRPMEEIVEEAKALKNAGVFRVAISGGTASLYGSENGEVNEKAFQNLLRNLCKIFGKSNLTAADLRVDLVTSDVLKSIKKYTRGDIEFGIESGSENLLNLMCKGFGLDDVRESVAQAKKIGLKVTGSFIVGHPLEKEIDFEATRDIVCSLKLHNYAISIAEPIPGTPLFNQMLRLNPYKNPVFQHSEEKTEGKLSLTISEQRALQLWLDAYETKYEKKCPRATYLRFLRRVQRENRRIEKVIRACSLSVRQHGLIGVEQGDLSPYDRKQKTRT